MTIHELARMVLDMRDAQRAYFRTRTQGDLESSKRREREIDRVVGEILSPPTLFDREAK